MSCVNDMIIVVLTSLGDYHHVDCGPGINTLVIEAPALTADLTTSGNSTYEMTHSDPPVVLVKGEGFTKFKILGGSGNDTLTGYTSDDELDGGLGDDELDGDSGEDTLLGGPGDDRLSVGGFAGDTGPDTIDGGDGFDHLLKLPRSGLSDVQDITLNFLLANGANFTLTDGTVVSNIERISNLQLGDGDDKVKFVPKSIDDRHQTHGGNGTDHLNVTLNHITDDLKTAVGTQLFIVYPDGQSPFAAAIVAANLFETFRIISGSGDDSIRGADGIDRLEGNAGNDKLTGAGGNDTLLGGAGDDILNGGDGNDRMFGGPGSDTFYGMAGIDTVNYFHSFAGVTIDISAQTPVASGGDADFDTLISIESIDGSLFDDQIYGSSGNNLLRGQAGADTILGRDGNDALGGGDGADNLQGDAGADRLYGDAGADTLHGGIDNDKMWGGAGDDLFEMRPGDGIDKIMDFEVASSDKVDLSTFQIASFSVLQSLMAQDAAHVRITLPGNDILIIENTLASDLKAYHFHL